MLGFKKCMYVCMHIHTAVHLFIQTCIYILSYNYRLNIENCNGVLLLLHISTVLCVWQPSFKDLYGHCFPSNSISSQLQLLSPLKDLWTPRIGNGCSSFHCFFLWNLIHTVSLRLYSLQIISSGPFSFPEILSSWLTTNLIPAPLFLA